MHYPSLTWHQVIEMIDKEYGCSCVTRGSNVHTNVYVIQLLISVPKNTTYCKENELLSTYETTAQNE